MLGSIFVVRGTSNMPGDVTPGSVLENPLSLISSLRWIHPDIPFFFPLPTVLGERRSTRPGLLELRLDVIGKWKIFIEFQFEKNN